METNRCSNCHQDMGQDAAFCLRCGLPVNRENRGPSETEAPNRAAEAPRVPPVPASCEKKSQCGQCQEIIEESCKFCPCCGAKAEAATNALKLVITAPDRERQEVALDGSPITIGSGDTAGVKVGDPYVSGAHCRFALDDEGNYRVEDMTSRNGTFVKITAPVQIETGQTVLAGTTLISIELA